MHSLELARIASVIAAWSESLAVGSSQIPETALANYWMANRQRFELWNRGLTRFTELERVGRSLAMRDWWLTHLSMIEEILISEILTRVMAAVGAMIDAKVANHTIEPLTQSVYHRHLEARNRVLRLLLFGRGSSVEEALRLNRLRRTAERWTDWLIGPLTGRHPETLPFVIDSGRARTMAEGAEFRMQHGLFASTLAMTMGWQGLRHSLIGLAQLRPAMPNANRMVAEAALACLGRSLFDSFGLPRTEVGCRIELGESLECVPGAGPRAYHPLFSSEPIVVAPAMLLRWTN